MCDAFAPAYQPRTILTTQISAVADIGEQSTKSKFIDALDQPYDRITKGSNTRTQLLNDVINEKGGRNASILQVMVDGPDEARAGFGIRIRRQPLHSLISL